jgi:hypothetical protein
VNVQFPFAQVACNCEQIIVNGCPLHLQLAVQNANTARLFLGPKSIWLLGRQSANQLVNGIHNYVGIHGHRDGRECLAELLVLKGGKMKLVEKYISQLAVLFQKNNAKEIQYYVTFRKWINFLTEFYEFKYVNKLC